MLPVEIDTHALEIVWSGRQIGRFFDVIGKILQKPGTERLKIAPWNELQPDLCRLGGLGKIGNELHEVFSFLRAFGKGDEKAGHEIGAVVEEIVLLEGGMTARLDGERGILALRIEALALVDDILVTALEAMMHAAVRRNEGGEPVARHGIGDDVGAGLLLEQDGGNESDETVAVDLLTLRRNGARTIDVGIEDDAEIGAIGFHGRTDGLHRRLVLGIGDVIGKAPVRLQKLRTRRIRPQRL